MTNKIAFIGAGIATSYTLIPLIEKLLVKPKNVEIYIIDKSEDFFSGLPYGERSGESVLLINNLKSFIPTPHRDDLKKWLNDNLNALLERFLKNGDALAKSWVDKNNNAIINGEWDQLYVPRFFFGLYIKQKVNKIVEQAAKSGHIKITLIKKETKNIKYISDGFEISFEDKKTLVCDKAILSIGSLPNKSLLSKDKYLNNNNAIYINQLYNPNLDTNLEIVQKTILFRSEKKLATNILILGANASGLEAIYRTYGSSLSINYQDCNFTCLSTHGVMPDGQIDEQKLKKFRTTHLNSLVLDSSLTANKIATAVNQDLDLAEKIDLGAASTVGIISEKFGTLLGSLSSDELIKFSWKHGNQIGRRQRCAGEHYLSVINTLIKKKRFEQIKGRFLELKPTNSGFELHYKNSISTKEETSKNQYNIVINCLGSIDLTNTKLPLLVQNIIDQGIVKPNGSQIGIQVNKALEASPNFYVAGPMLAGNLIENKALWHLEHCGRIIWSSNILANNIHSSLIS